MLTNAAAKAARPQARAYKLADGKGLYLFVGPKGLRSWRYKYRVDGREQLKVLGRFPAMSPTEARAARDQHRDALRAHQGSAPDDPVVSHTFGQTARRWHAHQLPRWSTQHAADVIAGLERDVFPAIGAAELASIDAPTVLTALRAIEARGSIETARRMRQRISAVFQHAMSEGLVTADPAAIVTRALAATPVRDHHPALTDPAELRSLLDAVDAVDAPAAARRAHLFLALTAVRFDAVRGARLDEIEDLDGPAPLWRVPPERMKGTRARKARAEHAHLVPLSRQAAIVARGCVLAGASGLLFPGTGTGGMIGERAIGDLYRRTSFAGRHVPHGWRASFSTVLNEVFPADRATIDRALAHTPRDKVEAAYNRAAQLTRRRELFQAWADTLWPHAS